MQTRFEWDPNKNRLNLAKHGLCFSDAEAILSGETISFKDDRFDYGEDRFITLGVLAERVVLLVLTQRDEVIRIISMRKANEREKKIYYQRLKEARQAN